MAERRRRGPPAGVDTRGYNYADVPGDVAGLLGRAGEMGLLGYATALTGVDDEGRTVGGILPLARNERTGEMSLAAPRILDLWNTVGGAVPSGGAFLGAGPVLRRGARAAEALPDQIARLLREGRASEVTDDMLGALGPNEQRRLYELYESGATGMDMPMDEASRMARARESGFDTEAFHASAATQPFAKFRPGSRGSAYFAATPNRAQAGASGGAQDLAHLSAGPTERAPQSIMPMQLRGDDVGNLRPSREAWEALPEVATEDQAQQLAQEVGGGYWWDVFDERQIRAPQWDANDNLVDPGEFQYVRKPYPAQKYAAKSGDWRESARMLPGYNTGDDLRSLDYARGQGQRGFMVSDEAGSSIAMSPEAPMRVRHARFDPRLSNNADLLASRAAPGGLLGGNEPERRLTFRDIEGLL